jgi:transcriptional regulator with XRE-family HTH domain
MEQARKRTKRPAPLTPTAVVAAKMRELRGHMPAEELARRMQAAGIPWTRLVVTKLEKGYRQSISVEELLALSHVLDVAPVNLLIPWDDDAPCWVAAGMPAYPAKQVRRWVRGWPHSAGLPGGDPKRYVANTPPSEDNVVFVPEEEFKALMEGHPTQQAAVTYEEIREQEKGHGDG